MFGRVITALVIGVVVYVISGLLLNSIGVHEPWPFLIALLVSFMLIFLGDAEPSD
jgi:lipopolysaccharide export LptBFGC system permease protein LptF